MRKIFLYVLAVFMLTSCDNLKKKDADDEVAVKSKKKALDEEEVTDEEETPKKKKLRSEEEEEVTTTSNEDNEGDDYTSKKSKYTKGWSSADKQTFMSTCVNGAKASMGETRAENYCSCMMDKIEKEYPTADDATNMTTQETTKMAKECLTQ